VGPSNVVPVRLMLEFRSYCNSTYTVVVIHHHDQQCHHVLALTNTLRPYPLYSAQSNIGLPSNLGNLVLGEN
jgi:hypothetical protein